MEVHKALGPGLVESTYEDCLCRELELQGIAFKKQVPLPVTYKGMTLACGYRMDLVVKGELVVELKAVDALLPIHEAQLLTYLRLSGLKRGLLLNFHVSLLRDEIRRRVL